MDAYFFYGEDQKDAAYKDAKLLEDQFGPVHMIYVEFPGDFVAGWNGMGTVGGKNVSIDYVEINLHGGPYNIQATHNTLDANGKIKREYRNINLSKLDSKEIGVIMLLSCNGGHLDYNNNVALQLLRRNDVQNVIASDGTVTYWPHKGSLLFGESKEVPYRATLDGTWLKYVIEAGSSRRFNPMNQGFMLFHKDDSGISAYSLTKYGSLDYLLDRMNKVLNNPGYAAKEYNG